VAELGGKAMRGKTMGWLVAVVLASPLITLAQIDGSGFVRGSISGTIVFADNRSATGVEVELWNAGGGLIATTFTEWDGGFRFNGVPLVPCIVVVEEPGYEGIHERVVPDDGPGLGLRLYLRKIGRDGPSAANHLVTVRELSIPRKAGEAFEKGLKRLAKRDPAGSLAHFRRAAQAFPDYYEAYSKMGTAHMILRDPEGAEQAFRKSIELSNGSYADPHRGLGLLFCRQHKYAEAEAILQKALELDPTFWGGYHLLGSALFGLNRLGEAEKQAQEAVRRKPDFPLTFLLLANIHMATHDDAALLKDLDTYLKLAPNGELAPQARQMREQVVQRLAKPENTVAASAVKP